MARWHLDELRRSLERRGWRVVAELPGDDTRISGSWKLERARDSAAGVIIDFEGLGGDGLHCLPMDESYACRARGTQHTLYFGRRGTPSSPARARWRQELALFTKAVGSASV
jgi:hypothetical protein